ncbi:cyclic pyranopterin monophosphate synthase MoaC [Chitiniphilus purpureus]|uniref:Cyclic pyranopterin monophosphate synthase MoaC n=2 Tax=Chitiniphilus purpureus TaxID=2981137 RepID=A0ABY6DSH4_9NEIS|nr:cyclic pyranopterin monophosphate synthase MoaC [Chitiniphilus sp. CD1]
MMNVGAHPETRRLARAEGHLQMRPDTLALIGNGSHSRGDVLGIARIAAIMAAKKTADLIPLSHPVPLTHVAVEFELDPIAHRVRCEASVETVGRTGVAMEALNAVNGALLTLYDLCKQLDRDMQLNGIRLLEQRCIETG